MKIRDILKRGAAGFLTATMLLANSAVVHAADTDVEFSEEVIEASDGDAYEEVGGEETDQPEDQDEIVQGGKGSREKGDGTKDNPWNLVFDEDVEGALSLTGDYYYFEAPSNGAVSIQGCVPDGNGIPSGWIITSDGNDRVYLDDPVKGGNEYGFSTVDRKTFGVKKGERFYIRFFKSAENGYKVYRLKISFENSDLWEAEPDSDKDPKKIELNKEYSGVIINYTGDDVSKDLEDYYKFTLKKKATVRFFLKSDMNTRLGLFKKSFSEVDKIEYRFNNDGKEAVLEKTLSAGDYFVKVDTAGTNWTEYKVRIEAETGADKKFPETGEAIINEQPVKSLKEAFSLMTEAKDYVIELKSDMVGEKSLTVPKKATSLIIYGNGHSIVIKGSKFTAKCPLTLEDVTIKTVNAKKEGVAENLKLNAVAGLTINSAVEFGAKSTKIQVKSDMVLDGSLSSNSVTAENLKLAKGSQYILGEGDKLTVKKELKAEDGAEIYLNKGFKPISLKGSASGKVTFDGEENLADGTQVLNCSSKKISADTLKEVFDCADLTANHTVTYLYYLSGSKAFIFGEAIEFNGKTYGLWKDAVADMNAAVKEAKKNKTSVSFNVVINGDVNMGGKFALPKKGYEGLTIEGNGHSLTFTSDITLTADLTISDDTTLIKVNKKNEKVAGKIKEGKYTYTGPQISQ